MSTHTVIHIHYRGYQSSMTKKLSARIFDVVVAHLSDSSFSTLLTPPKSMDRASMAEVGNELSIDYTVPSALCRLSSDGLAVFSVSAMLALLDDFSSYALMMQDRNHRPGVSVTLNTEIVRPCKAGEKIRLVSRCDKIGKSIAFCSMELRSSSGEVLARGKHIKYVVMGFIWDLLTGALLFPLVLMILEYLLRNKKSKSKKNPEETGGDVMKDEVGKLFTSLNLAPVDDASKLFAINESAEDQPKRKKRQIAPVIDATESCFRFKVSKATSNVLGAMHGGAVAAAAEEACVQAAAKNAKIKGGMVDSIDISYISPAKGELVIAVKEDPHAVKGPAYVGRVLSIRTGQVCSEFTCRWSTK